MIENLNIKITEKKFYHVKLIFDLIFYSGVAYVKLKA